MLVISSSASCISVRATVICHFSLERVLFVLQVLSYSLVIAFFRTSPVTLFVFLFFVFMFTFFPCMYDMAYLLYSRTRHACISLALSM